MFKSNKKILAGLVLGSMMGTLSAFAGGFQMYSTSSAESLSLGGATAGRSDIVSNAWYNPAAVTTVSKSDEVQSPTLQLSGTLIKMSSQRSSSFDDFSMESDEYEMFPSMAYVHPLQDTPFIAMFSITNPYGMETHWNEDNWKSIYYGGQKSPVDTCISNTYFTPALAWKATDQLTLAGGISAVYGQIAMKQNVNLGPTYGTGHSFEVDGDDWGYGWNLAAHYKFTDEWSAGIKYQSSVLMHYKGDSSSDINPAFTGGYNLDNKFADGTIRLPQSVTMGVAYAPTQDWTFTGDIVWTDWTCYKDLTVNLDNGAVLAVEKKWNDVFSYRLGAEYKLTQNWKLRGGYCYDNSPIPSSGYRSAELPGTDYNEFSLGCGYETRTWGVDFAYSYLLFNRGEDQLGATFKSDIHVMMLSWKYSF
jgi:long-chain fatty acid transport protein